MNLSNISYLKEVAQKIGSNNLLEELEDINQRVQNPNAPIMIPLVGEFSSGKTTLINSLTDSHALETATKPTTATIFEIHFGAPHSGAQIVFEDGTTEENVNIKDLKNENLTNAKVVTVFDTSTKVSSYTILVDTPGISSPDPKHQQTLVDFLPQADALILVIDINQQLTKSLTDFIKTVQLTSREIYTVLTKSDTKSDAQIQAAKDYFAKNCEIPIANLAAVSAQNNSLDDILIIFRDIEKRKSVLLQKANEHRLDVIAENLLSTIKILLNASQGLPEVEEEIREQKQALTKVQRKIESIINNIDVELDDLNKSSSRKFEDQISSQLTSLINTKSSNYDNEAVSIINSTASAIIGDYRRKVMDLIANESKASNSNDEISLSSLSGIDLSSIGIEGLSYDLSLNEMGHEYDGWIKTGVIAVGAAAAVGAVVATGGGALGAAGGALTVSSAVDVADTVTDVSSVMSNRKLVRRMESAVKYGKAAADKYSTIDQFNAQGMGESGTGKGMIDSLAGFIAEKTMSKPQRMRAIRLYIDDRLAPEFKHQIDETRNKIIETVKSVINEAAQSTIDERITSLEELKQQLNHHKDEVEQKMSVLREMETQLLTL